MSVRHFNLVFTAVGPIHIGNGEKYGKKDYFKVDRDHIAVLDVPRFVERLDRRQFEGYCAFLATDSSSVLQDYLDREPGLMEHARACTSYTINARLSKNRGGKWQYLDVFQFAKDPHGHPYVPGSSVKGMLRTAILGHLISSDHERYLRHFDREAVQAKADMSSACGRIEREAFWRETPDPTNKTVVNDIMRYVSVSDSEPLSTDELVFAKKYDLFALSDSEAHKLAMGKISKEAEYREGNALNIYRECIRPGTRISLRLDVDERIDAHLCGLVLDDAGIASVLGNAFDLYKRCFLDQFDIGEASGPGTKGRADDGRCRYVGVSGMRCRNSAIDGTGYCRMHQDKAATNPKQVTCYLGGGVDFDSKTVINALLEDDPARVYEISRILYAQFPTRLSRAAPRQLKEDVLNAGFQPRPMSVHGRQKKDDHRHWKDAELGVSPHTAKLGIVGDKKYPMGKCMLEIKEA